MSGALPESLADLRNCLFFEHRRMRHCGEEPDDLTSKYLGAVMEAIRGKVAAAGTG